MATSDLITEPSSRQLRIFAFDPSMAARIDTAGLAVITIAIPWETALQPGPVGEYIEVVDADPASGMMYKPVDLNDSRLLAQNGLAPSEANPQFHQQMIYAVAMATICHFEKALGRVALWSSHRTAGSYQEQFVRRLRIYPHALRDRNAFYSPQKKALLFGYFPVSIKNAANTPGTLVFTCLSHDIIAHETTHALLDGVHPRFNEAVNADVLAFHEAFADIVALFQHFAYPGVLRDQIGRTRGDLSRENFLGQLAQQFGKASGRGGSLRDAIGGPDPVTGEWKPRIPDVHALDKTPEPHDRGAILVAAVFGAFLNVYRARTRDLYRIASEGTGVLRAGDIHPDLANRLADEAARSAEYTLQMCIRAIDYCPPVGLTFGDYLRGIVTGDYELNPDDPYGYRIAFVESFQQWGINPEGMQSMSVEGLLWPTGDAAAEEANVRLDRTALRKLFTEDQRINRPEQRVKAQAGQPLRLQPWNLQSDRYETWLGAEKNAAAVWGWLMKGPNQKLAPAIGLVLDDHDPPATAFRSKAFGTVAVEVHSVRTALRRGPRGSTVSDLVVEITQRRRGYFDDEEQKRKDAADPKSFEDGDQGDFKYRAGCTLLIDPMTMEVRRVIKTRGTIKDDKQLTRVRRFLTEGSEPVNAFARTRDSLRAREPFALLHRNQEA